MLTNLIASLPVRVAHWLMDVLGVRAGVHTWCPGICPCGAYEDDQ